MPYRSHSPALIARVRGAALRGVVTAIGIVDSHAVVLITSPPKSGRIYRRRGVSHQASAPGEAPASDTGQLVNSRRIEIDAAALRGRLIFASRKAIYLERGTRNMAARPFARRALLEKKRAIRAAINGEIKAEFRK